ATTSSPVGAYSIVPTVSGATLANYTVVPHNGILTVQDTTPPVPNLANLPAVTAQCSATLPAAPTSTDAADGQITGVPDKTGPFAQGDTTITWTYTDSKNNSSTQVQAVHVHDTTPPVPNLANLPAVTAQCSATLPAAPTSTDAADGQITGVPDKTGPFAQGDTTITWTYTDSKNNSSTQVQAVHVHDTIAPVANAASLTDVTGQCSAALPAAPTATDACDGPITGVPDKTGPFAQGDTTITWTYTDSKNNSSTQVQAVHVHDTIAPVANAASLTDVTGQCSAALPAAPTATDACDGPITGVPDKTGPFAQGDTTITWTYTDSKNNSSTQVQAVHVHDTIAPVANAASLTDVTGQCSAALPAAPTATDACDGPITGVPDKTGPFAQGDTTITWTYTDSKNNSSTQVQAVHVHDTIAPVANAVSLTDVTGQCSAALPAAPTATDACDGPITGVPDKTGPFAQGDTTITWTYTDSKN